MDKTRRIYFNVKEEIKNKILAAYGTQAKFLKTHPELGMTKEELSLHLNPARSSNLTTILRICNVCGIELVTSGMPKKVA